MSGTYDAWYDRNIVRTVYGYDRNMVRTVNENMVRTVYGYDGNIEFSSWVRQKLNKTGYIQCSGAIETWYVQCMDHGYNVNMDCTEYKQDILDIQSIRTTYLKKHNINGFKMSVTALYSSYFVFWDMIR